MKIAVFNLPNVKLGKANVKDTRLDEVDKITKAKKKTYVQVELVDEKSLMDSDAIMTSKDSSSDLVLQDLEFVENRMAKDIPAEEKALLAKLKASLEKEEFAFKATLTDAEKQIMASYSIATKRPVILAAPEELEDMGTLLFRALGESGYISFFTTGEKDTRAWLVKKGATAWEASGAIHSDIQQGFIRAEIINFNDFISCGGENAAKQAGKQHLEQKDYVMQDTDLANFRFNK